MEEEADHSYHVIQVDKKPFQFIRDIFIILYDYENGIERKLFLTTFFNVGNLTDLKKLDKDESDYIKSKLNKNL